MLPVYCYHCQSQGGLVLGLVVLVYRGIEMVVAVIQGNRYGQGLLGKEVYDGLQEQGRCFT